MRTILTLLALGLALTPLQALASEEAQAQETQEQAAEATEEQATEAVEEPAPAAVVPASGQVTVNFTSTRPNVTISMIRGRGVGMAGSTTIISTFYEDLCMAPCAVQLDAGLYDFMAYGKGTTRVVEKFDLRQDATLHVTANPAILRSSGNMLTALGLSTALFGGMFLAIDNALGPDAVIGKSGDLALLFGGLGATAGGIPLAILGKSKLEKVQ